MLWFFSWSRSWTNESYSCFLATIATAPKTLMMIMITVTIAIITVINVKLILHKIWICCLHFRDCFTQINLLYTQKNGHKTTKLGILKTFKNKYLRTPESPNQRNDNAWTISDICQAWNLGKGMAKNYPHHIWKQSYVFLTRRCTR